MTTRGMDDEAGVQKSQLCVEGLGLVFGPIETGLISFGCAYSISVGGLRQS